MGELKFNDYIEFKYKYTGEFHEGLAVVKNNENEFGFINKKGKEVIQCQYRDAKDFSEGLAAVQNSEGLWGYINEQGEEVIQCQYLDAKDFSEGLAAVKTKSANYIYIDKSGNTAIKRVYSFGSQFSDGYAVIIEKGNNFSRYLDKNGNHLGMYRGASSFLNGKAIVMDDEYLYLVNKSFEPITPRKLKKKDILNIYICGNGFLLIQNDGEKYGYLSENFEKITPFSFLNAGVFNDGIAIIELFEDYIGFLNEEGKITAFSKQHQYQKIKDFSEGLAAVQNIQGLWGYINKEGKEVIPCQFKQADSFSEGLAGVIDNDDNFCYIDKQGKKKITLNNIYYSSLELDDQVITIKADSPQELAAEKLRVLSIAKEDIIASTINMIDQLAYTESSGLYKPQTRRRTNKKDNKKIES